MNSCYYADGSWCLYVDDYCNFINCENCPYYIDNGFYPYGFGEETDETNETDETQNNNINIKKK